MGVNVGNKIADGFKRVRVTNQFVREFLAEFLGTFALVLFGNGSVAQVVLSNGTKGDFFTINWAYGLAVSFGVLIAGGVSGGHINPAVSLAFALVGKFPWKKVLVYMAAQYLGAITASAVLFGTYYEAMVKYEADQGNTEDVWSTPGTAGIHATYPSPHLSHVGGFADLIVSSALLLICICAVTDKRNMEVVKGQFALYIGLSVAVIGMSFGFNAGYALNPARDLGPRLFTLMAGWGTAPFTYENHWWIVPFISTHVGSIIGTVVYMFFVENHWGQDEDKVIELKKVSVNAEDEEAKKSMLENGESKE